MSVKWSDSNHTWDDPEVLWAGMVLDSPPDVEGAGPPPDDPTPAPAATPGGGAYSRVGQRMNPFRLTVRPR